MAKNRKIKSILDKVKITKKANLNAFEKLNYFKNTSFKDPLKIIKKRRRYWAAPVSVAILLFLLIASFLTTDNNLDKTKKELIQNPSNLETNLVLAQELLTNNQFEEAERILLIAQNQLEQQKDLKETEENFKEKIENLWLRKHYSDPKDITKLIDLWEQIVINKPHYRDAFLQLAYLYYQDGKNQLAKQSLEHALEIDPNFELPEELKNAILP